jgi:hypothetical protein
MSRAFVLIHSPLVGPATWSALARELRRRRIEVALPDLDGDESDPTPLWRQHAQRAADTLRSTRGDVILVGHSGAGALLPAIRDIAGREVAGYVFVDAGLPAAGPRKGYGAFAAHVDRMHAEGRRFPDWTDATLREVLPDPALRRALLAQVRPQPARFWDEEIPIFARWPDAPCGYLRFAPNPTYDSAAAEAQQRGWPYRALAGAHFHMLVDPVAVANAITSIADEIGVSP